ncbi:hypothetical protein BDR22DRAFT_884599 [Usnea florida]
MSSKATQMDATSSRIMELHPIIYESTSPKQEDEVTIVELDGGWQSCDESSATFLNEQVITHSHWVFLSSNTFTDPSWRRQKLSERYQIPECFWTPPCSGLNGCFGCENLYDERAELRGHITWFRFFVKQLAGHSSYASDSKYIWHEMGFCTRWLTSGFGSVVCVNVPPPLQKRITNALEFLPKTNIASDAYTFHVLIADEVVKLYDDSVWQIRNVVRKVETSRSLESQPTADYPMLHETARHSIHSNETLEIAVECILAMCQQHTLLYKLNSSKDRFHEIIHTKIHQALQFQLQVLRSLKARSQANEARLRNEITLAFNTLAQHDSHNTLLISQAARNDSFDMRAIALLTLVFLPSTLVSTIFSMSFFNFSPNDANGQPSGAVSPYIWIYLAIAVPLTLVTVALWLGWQRWRSRVAVKPIEPI